MIPPQLMRARAQLTQNTDEVELVLVQSPKVGRFTAAVAAGQLIEPNQLLGTLEVLHHRIALLAPLEARGRILEIKAHARATPVGFADTLMSVEIGVTGAGVSDSRAAERATAGGDPLRAPMDGLFYRRSSPEAPPFATEGQRITPGMQIGLVEVMKFFYPFLYEGLEPRTLVRFAIDDAAPMESGQIIAYLE